MANDYSTLSVHDSATPLNSTKTTSGTPKSVTLSFIRQFARTCVAMQGCALGSVILN